MKKTANQPTKQVKLSSQHSLAHYQRTLSPLVCLLLVCVGLLGFLTVACGKKNQVRVKEIYAPDEKLLLSALDEWGEASLVLCDDGSYTIYTEEDYDNLWLLKHEYHMTETHFSRVKGYYDERAATQTNYEYKEGEPPVGTHEDYRIYLDVSYRDYAEEYFYGLGDFRKYFNSSTYRLLDRPKARVEVTFVYLPHLVDNEEEQAMVHERNLDDQKLVSMYIEAFNRLLKDPEVRKAILDSVNSDGYKTGDEAAEIEIRISDNETTGEYIDTIVERVDNYETDDFIVEYYEVQLG